MFLRGMGQKLRQLRISVEHADTLDDIPVVEFVLLTSDRDFLTDKLREPIREPFVDDAVQLLRARK